MSTPIRAKITEASILLASVTLLIAVCVFPYLYKMQSMEDMRAKTILELTQKGVDPIAARCSIADARDYLCIVWVSARTGKESTK